ncbi:PE-PPE domain-containing protein [Mycolicibacter nonchromogenicus]|uniref:PE-PPE domain-containing protein n=1 Tax=Mycolicibacter nonchromogenicus TaxID=1782 RepID=A0A1X1ZIL3_MYCNO|nr:PE-PPE domain-containing protein [Mycolicibacter nonchromogenicus]OBI08831.1 PE-PPE domain-containing protein [Mycolicibacter heraklionensis]ORW23152.1 PE-PPE domain-containing protein [Mycolicibacter nonchromogenicus]
MQHRCALGAALLLAAAVPSVSVGPGAPRLDATARPDVALLADEGWVMGPTSIPDPTVDGYLDAVLELFLQPASPWFPGQPTFPGSQFEGLVTPEQFCPLVCLPPPNPQLTFAESVARGTEILHTAIWPQLQNGDDVTVFGYSQSATISTQEMSNLLAAGPGGYDPANLHFVLIGNPNNPLGGVLTRLPAYPLLGDQPVHLPFLGIPLSIGPTPTTGFDTDIYTGAYDGLANFPQDPANLLAMLNALIGTATVHFSYADAENLADTIDLGRIGDTDFYLIPQQLPILWPVYQLGDIGKVIGDALAPMLKLVIDWGYGNPGDPFVGVNGTDAVGPWAVTATGQLADGSDVAGFVMRMDPLQMLAGLQYAAVHSVVDPVNDLLGLAGQSPLPDSFVDALLAGYHLINTVDAQLLEAWSQLAVSLDVADWLGPDAVFNGEPLISLAPMLEAGAVVFEILNLLGA